MSKKLHPKKGKAKKIAEVPALPAPTEPPLIPSSIVEVVATPPITLWKLFLKSTGLAILFAIVMLVMTGLFFVIFQFFSKR